MKMPTLIVFMIIGLSFLGCSKEAERPKSSAKRLVPATAAEVMASADYKLEHTTKSGISCYVRPLTSEVADSISVDSPDHAFLSYGAKSCLLVPIRDGKIIPELSTEDSGEVQAFLFKRMMADDPEAQKALKSLGK